MKPGSEKGESAAGRGAEEDEARDTHKHNDTEDLWNKMDEPMESL